MMNTFFLVVAYVLVLRTVLLIGVSLIAITDFNLSEMFLLASYSILEATVGVREYSLLLLMFPVLEWIGNKSVRATCRLR